MACILGDPHPRFGSAGLQNLALGFQLRFTDI
jgi:hypothetical protein